MQRGIGQTFGPRVTPSTLRADGILTSEADGQALTGHPACRPSAQRRPGGGSRGRLPPQIQAKRTGVYSHRDSLDLRGFRYFLHLRVSDGDLPFFAL